MLNPTMQDFMQTRFKVPWLTPLLALLLSLPAGAAQPLGCLIEALRITDVGSPVVGIVHNVEVERGERVTKGQVLAVLRAPVERASLSVASSRAESSAELQAAIAAANFNRDRLVRAEDLFRQQFISQQALDQARSESELADQKLVQAREQRQVSRQERDVAAAQLSQRVIRSPFDGVVAERYVSAGERVDDKPLLRIAKVDPLRVQLVVPVAMYSQVQLGGSANVVPELPGAATMSARVTMIDKVVDAASNTFRVHLELPNPNGALPAGLRCKAEFGAPPPPAVQSAPVAAPIEMSAAPAEVIDKAKRYRKRDDEDLQSNEMTEKAPSGSNTKRKPAETSAAVGASDGGEGKLRPRVKKRPADEAPVAAVAAQHDEPKPLPKHKSARSQPSDANDRLAQEWRAEVPEAN